MSIKKAFCQFKNIMFNKAKLRIILLNSLTFNLLNNHRKLNHLNHMLLIKTYYFINFLILKYHIKVKNVQSQS